MGLNLHLVVIEHSTVAGLAAVGWRPTGEVVAVSEATHSWYDGVAAHADGDHVVLVDPTMALGGTTAELAAELGTTVVSAMFGSTGDTHAYQVDGPGVARLVVVQELAVVVEQGAPLLEEAGVPQDRGGEDWLLALLAARGHRLDLDVTDAVVLTRG